MRFIHAMRGLKMHGSVWGNLSTPISRGGFLLSVFFLSTLFSSTRLLDEPSTSQHVISSQINITNMCLDESTVMSSMGAVITRARAENGEHSQTT